MVPSASSTTDLMVVEPASMPSQTGPETSAIEPIGTAAWACLVSNSARSAASTNSGRMLRVVTAIWLAASRPAARCGRLSAGPIALYAAPSATYSWPLSGVMYSSTFSPSARTKAARSSGRKCSGPPRKITLPRIGCPQARPATVWVATAWKTEAAISEWAAPWFSSGWTSDFANTPQRDAIGYRFW